MSLPNLVWLPEAVEDARRLQRFLLENAPDIAGEVGRVLLTGARQLQNFPESGRPMNDETGRRELFLPFGAGGYVLRYMLDGRDIYLL